MIDDDTSALREALAAGPTPGPWTVGALGHGEQEVARVNTLEVVPPRGVELAEAYIDASFLAAASPDRIARLLDEIERLRERNHYEFLSRRGIDPAIGDVICAKCQGAGILAYGSTSTWRGGAGGSAITSDVCDHCWGSGTENRKWLNLREASAVRNTVERLRAEVEALRADAERYLWLRDEADSPTVCEYVDGEWVPVHPENIDTVVDAARNDQAPTGRNKRG